MIINANSLHIPLANNSVQMVVTSPPYYGLRDYGIDGQLGLEESPEAYVANMVTVFREVRRVLKDDGVCFLNLGDSYAGSSMTGGMNSMEGENKRSGRMFDVVKSKRNASRWGGGNLPATGSLKPKDLIGIPWLVAFALRADGWWLRQDIIWAKNNPMPESVTDRCTKAHEYIFLLTKSARYFWDQEAVKETSVSDWTYDQERRLQRVLASGGALSGGTGDGISKGDTRNPRSVWTINTQPCKEAHFATFPEEIPERCIKAGSRFGDVVLDPFAGSGTTGIVCNRLGRQFVGLDLNMSYLADIAKRRIYSQPVAML